MRIEGDYDNESLQKKFDELISSSFNIIHYHEKSLGNGKFYVVMICGKPNNGNVII
ncbi:MAG: hypothetical protein ACOC3V_00240 [bacterium]